MRRIAACYTDIYSALPVRQTRVNSISLRPAACNIGYNRKIRRLYPLDLIPDAKMIELHYLFEESLQSYGLT